MANLTPKQPSGYDIDQVRLEYLVYFLKIQQHRLVAWQESSRHLATICKNPG